MTATRAIRKQSRILAPNGKPLSMMYALPSASPKQQRPRPQLQIDSKRNISEAHRAELVNHSRLLRARVSALAAAIEQKNNWAFGDAWRPHYFGQNKKWAQEAAEFLEQQFFPFCNVRGPQFDMRRTLLLSGQAWDTDGDDLLVLTETENGFPQIALFPSTRVRNSRFGFGRTEKVKGGKYDGATLFDGVFLNDSNRHLAYKLVSEDGAQEMDISAFNAELAFEPIWSDQVRGIPKPSVALLAWMKMEDIDGFIQDGIMRSSKYAMVVKNAEADATIGNQVTTSELSPTAEEGNSTIVGGMDDDRKVHYAEMAGGGGVFLYMDSTTGESIEPIKYENPHPNTEAFIQRVRRDSLASIGWFYELLHLDDTGRAASRQLCDIANQAIWDRQATGERRWKRIVSYAIAKAMKNGYLSKNNDGADPYKWAPGLPKEMSVDAGNDHKMQLEAIRMGTSTKEIAAAKAGYNAEAIAEKRFEEVNGTAEKAAALYANLKQFGVTFQYCYELLEQRSPNPPVNPAPQQQPQQKAA